MAGTITERALEVIRLKALDLKASTRKDYTAIGQFFISLEEQGFNSMLEADMAREKRELILVAIYGLMDELSYHFKYRVG